MIRWQWSGGQCDYRRKKSQDDLLWKEYSRGRYNRSSKLGPAYPNFKHQVNKDFLCIDGLHKASSVGDVLGRGRVLVTSTQASDGEELCRERQGPVASTQAPDGQKLGRGRRRLAVSTQAPDGKNQKVIHDGAPFCINESTAFVALLRACAKNKDLHRGTRLHDDILKRGLLEKCSDALVAMYAKCGAFAKAKDLLDVHKSRNVSSWTALIAGYARRGQGQDALNCFEQMQHNGISPDAVTFTCVLKACGSIKSVEKGAQIHDEIARQGLLRNDIVLGNALVDMYAKCGALAKAQQVFEELPFQDVVSWSSLIAGYAQQGQAQQALNCFEQMQHEGLSPDAVTFTCILKACGSIKAADKGKAIHDEITKQGLLKNNIVLGTALVDMYAKCGALTKAQQVLEDLPSRNHVSWKILIAEYVEQGQGEQALCCFERMQREGHSPDAVTLACILKACGSVNAADKGKQIHDDIARQGLLGNDVMLGTALVDMYAKCGALAKARQVLEELPSRDLVSWNTLISGYAQQGQGEEALHCFKEMQCEGLSPDAVTFSRILNACGTIGAADKGEQIHDEIARQGLIENNIVLGTALVDMYAKCGALGKARQVLEELPCRDVVSWSALISGYALQGQGEEALNCFAQMEHEGLSPNGVTFSCVLNACSHLGLVEEGHMHFVNMITKYGMKPDLEHYICMVDLYGRAGHLDKAARVIQEMPSSDHSSVWSALLSACSKWGNINVGKWAFEQAVQVDKCDGALYVLMANIYSTADMQEDAQNVEAMRLENGAWRSHVTK